MWHAGWICIYFVVQRALNTCTFEAEVAPSCAYGGDVKPFQKDSFMTLPPPRLVRGSVFSGTQQLVSPHLTSHLALKKKKNPYEPHFSNFHLLGRE